MNEFNVYHKKDDGKLFCIKVGEVEDHQEAILVVKESLVAAGTGYNDPVLALIIGGKK